MNFVHKMTSQHSSAKPSTQPDTELNTKKSSTRSRCTQLVASIAFGLMLSACGSSPKQTKQTSNTPVNNAQIIASEPESAFERIAQTYLKSDDTVARNEALINLANDYVTQADCISSNIVLKAIEPNITEQLTRSKSNLLKAECALLAADENIQGNQQMLSLIQSWLLENSFLAPDWRQRNTVAKAQFYAYKREFPKAIATIFQAMSANDIRQNASVSNRIWSWFSLSTEAQRQTLQQRFSMLSEHYNILQIIEDEALSDIQRQNNIRQWLAQYPQSSISQNTPTQILHYLSLANSTQNKTAVLLPLSGRLSSQGNAIKQGILAAYFERTQGTSADMVQQSEVSIEFIDTGSVNSLNKDISADYLNQFDTIIGPLLKSHIEELSYFPLVNQKKILLNQHAELRPRVENQATSIDAQNTQNKQSIHAFYSLSPEQEAVQLVKLMRKKNIQFPVLIQDNSNIAERMRKAFEQAWTSIPFSGANQTNKSPLEEEPNAKRPVQIINYTDNKSMRIGITAALDVLQSQRRIAQLNNLSSDPVLSVTRNRRDVDAFVVFAKPDDVELINPIIESSISLFTEQQIPVFASSYSYDHKQNKNSQRDLRNLVFIDMPWLLPQGREQVLSKQVDTLFNQPPSAFLRLFAFGHDALLVSDNIAQLSTFTHMQVSGLTGVLSIAENNELNRELANITITNDSSN